MNVLIDQVKSFLANNPQDLSRDQVFLVDQKVIEKMVEAAGVNSSDRVLEVGPGLGFITRELAQRAGEVVAIEIDVRFKPYLDSLPKNVQIVWGDAYKLLNNMSFLSSVKPPTKTVSCVPYSQAQNMLHNYTNWPWYQGDIVWLAPLSLVAKVNQEPILGAYFHAETIGRVAKRSFYPEPNTTSAIIRFKRIPDPQKTGSLDIYLRRWLYNHEDIKVKNSLREGIIKAAYDLKHRRITKNEARKLIDSLDIPKAELEVLTNNIRPEYYFDAPAKLLRWFEGL